MRCSSKQSNDFCKGDPPWSTYTQTSQAFAPRPPILVRILARVTSLKQHFCNIIMLITWSRSGLLRLCNNTNSSSLSQFSSWAYNCSSFSKFRPFYINFCLVFHSLCTEYIGGSLIVRWNHPNRSLHERKDMTAVHHWMSL